MHNLPDRPAVDYYTKAKAKGIQKRKKGPIADRSTMSFSYKTGILNWLLTADKRQI
jgi:hypothetical protein